ncbi:hypothetical protein H5410_045682 [Solanum commersonii]|uniref:DUF4283 domain-containing protein n=1 Tax=Solanum commersonii TaxID=4109 RepID=A0A9J5XED2_SOLCO|nr:hypothetical protein H5410_045682 [Solanum commersonii]
MDGGISGRENSGENRTQLAKIYEKFGSGNHSPLLDIRLSEIASNLDGRNAINNQSVQPTESMMNLNKGTYRNAQTLKGMIHSQLHLQDTTSNRDTTKQGKSTEKLGHDRSKGMNKDNKLKVRKCKQVSNQVHNDKKGQNDQTKDINQQGGTNRLQHGNDRANMDYRNNFPRICNNFLGMILISKGIGILLVRITTPCLRAMLNSQQHVQIQNNAKQDIIPEPAPFTIVQSFAAELWMSIDGQLMRIQAWTPYFKPEEETIIVPIWVALLEIPWYCYNKVLLTTILIPIGNVLYLDSPSSQKTRGSMAKFMVGWMKGVRRNQLTYRKGFPEDEFDEETQSIKDEKEDGEGEEESAHLIKTFGSTFQSDFKNEIQTAADQQNLSPRGRKQVRQHNKQPSMSISANTSRPNTRSKSKGF